MLELSCANTERIFHQFSHKCLGFGAIWSNFALYHLSHLSPILHCIIYPIYMKQEWVLFGVWLFSYMYEGPVDVINCGREAYLSLFVFKIKLHIESSSLPHHHYPTTKKIIWWGDIWAGWPCTIHHWLGFIMIWHGK